MFGVLFANGLSPKPQFDLWFSPLSKEPLLGSEMMEKQKADPLWKVERLLQHLNKRCRDMWVPGKWLAIDEQTLGFQGASGMKLRISYKREGDGFQCDAISDAGHTFSFWFRHGP